MIAHTGANRPDGGATRVTLVTFTTFGIDEDR
jgi:hypothetical protein